MSLTADKLEFGELVNKAFAHREFQARFQYSSTGEVINFSVAAIADTVTDTGKFIVTSYNGPVSKVASGMFKAEIPEQEVDVAMNYKIGTFDLDKAYSMKENDWQKYVYDELQKSVKYLSKIENIEVVDVKGKISKVTQSISSIREL